MNCFARKYAFGSRSLLTSRNTSNLLLRFSTYSVSNENNSSTLNCFKIMGLEPSFDISQDELKKSYKSLMNKYHPDRHTLKAQDEQETLAEEASRISRSYEVLQDNHERALHLLELGGMPMEDNISGDIVGQQFLFQIMELREEVDDAESETDLQKLFAENKERMNSTCEELGVAFANNDLVEAKRLTAMLQYWKRIDELIIEKL